MCTLRLRTARRAKVLGNWGVTVMHTNRWTHSCLNNMWTSFFNLNFFCHLSITSCSHEKYTRLFPLFHTASNESWVGPGNRATKRTQTAGLWVHWLEYSSIEHNASVMGRKLKNWKLKNIGNIRSVVGRFQIKLHH